MQQPHAHSDRPPPPLEILCQLLRFDTSNPPGNEGPCIDWIGSLLAGHGIAVARLQRDPARPSLIARLAGRGSAPPLLLYGHVDVVPTAGQDWRFPPFEATVSDGFVWGRGALDMKGGLAMMIAALLRLRASGDAPPGDVILAALADEEAGGHLGAGFLVAEHAGRFAGVRHALGEFGGFTFEILGKRFVPIMVGEKEHARVRLTVRGPGGHGSMPRSGAAPARLGALLVRLENRSLPPKITPIVRSTIRAIARHLPLPRAFILRGLLNPTFTDRILSRVDALDESFGPLLHDTIAPTIVRAGSNINVIPAEATLELDARLLPGTTTDGFRRDLERLAGEGIEVEIERDTPAPPHCDLSQLEMLGQIVRGSDSGLIPIPFLLPAVTDARHFAKLGIQTYGFTPMQLPREMSFTRLIHAADERIPVEALEEGTISLMEAVRRYHG